MSSRPLITCEWFDGGKQGRDSFPPEALNIVDQAAAGPTRP
jgi:hypothetical protein